MSYESPHCTCGHAQETHADQDVYEYPVTAPGVVGCFFCSCEAYSEREPRVAWMDGTTVPIVRTRQKDGVRESVVVGSAKKVRWLTPNQWKNMKRDQPRLPKPATQEQNEAELCEVLQGPWPDDVA